MTVQYRGDCRGDLDLELQSSGRIPTQVPSATVVQTVFWVPAPHTRITIPLGPMLSFIFFLK